MRHPGLRMDVNNYIVCRSVSFMLCYVMLTKFICKIANSGDYTFPYIPHLSYILHVTFSVGYCPIT